MPLRVLASDHTITSYGPPEIKCNDELCFDNWKWYRRITEIIDGDDCSPTQEELSVKDAKGWFECRHRSSDSFPAELVFHTNFAQEFQVLLKGETQTRRFNPVGWILLGIGHRQLGFDQRGNVAEWTDEYLFNASHQYLLITELHDGVTIDPGEPKAEVLTASQAAQWCFDHCSVVPPDLLSYLSDRFITPPPILDKPVVDSTVDQSTEHLKQQDSERDTLKRLSSALKSIINCKDNDELSFYCERFIQRAKPVCRQAEINYQSLIDTDHPLPTSVKVLCRIAKWIKEYEDYCGYDDSPNWYSGVAERAKQYNQQLVACVGPDYSSSAETMRGVRDALLRFINSRASGKLRNNEVCDELTPICLQTDEYECDLISKYGEARVHLSPYDLILHDVLQWYEEVQKVNYIGADDSEMNELVEQANALQLRCRQWFDNHCTDFTERGPLVWNTRSGPEVPDYENIEEYTPFDNVIHSVDQAPIDSGSVQCAEPTDDKLVRPIEKRSLKEQRDDWLLDTRGTEREGKFTNQELAELLLKKCAVTGWSELEPSSINDVIRTTYYRRFKKPWPYDNRGKKKDRSRSVK